MLYPSPYRAGMSSLGYQWILTRLREAGVAAERVFLPDDVAEAERPPPPLSYETLTPLSRFPILCVSLAYELELAGLIKVLELAGIPPLRRDRPDHPVILLGGPSPSRTPSQRPPSWMRCCSVRPTRPRRPR